MVTQFDNPTSPVLLGRGDNGSLPPADALPSDTSNTVVKNAIRLDLNFANMVGRAVYPFVLMLRDTSSPISKPMSELIAQPTTGAGRCQRARIISSTAYAAITLSVRNSVTDSSMVTHSGSKID